MDTHATAHGGHDADHGHPSGWRRFVYSTNHKDIGTMYLVFAIFAAQLGTLAVEHAFGGCSEPGFVDAAGNCIYANTERRHRERMNDIGAGHQHVYDLIDRHYHFVVDGKKPQLARLEVFLRDHQ